MPKASPWGACGALGILALAVLGADAVRSELGDETWSAVAVLAAESNLADGALLAAKAFAAIWNRRDDRIALGKAADWAGYAAGLAAEAGWKADECAYWHAMLLSQRAKPAGAPKPISTTRSSSWGVLLSVYPEITAISTALLALCSPGTAGRGGSTVISTRR